MQTTLNLLKPYRWKQEEPPPAILFGGDEDEVDMRLMRTMEFTNLNGFNLMFESGRLRLTCRNAKNGLLITSTNQARPIPGLNVGQCRPGRLPKILQDRKKVIYRVSQSKEPFAWQGSILLLEGRQCVAYKVFHQEKL